MKNLFIARITRASKDGKMFFSTYPFIEYQEAEKHIKQQKDYWNGSDFPVTTSYIEEWEFTNNKFVDVLPF